MALLSNEWVLGGVIIGALFGGAAVWHKTRSWFVKPDKDE